MHAKNKTSKRMVGIKRVFQFVSFYLLTGVPHLHKCGIPGTMAWLSSGEILYPIRSLVSTIDTTTSICVSRLISMVMVRARVCVNNTK